MVGLVAAETTGSRSPRVTGEMAPSQWSAGLAEWGDEQGNAYLSVAFTWRLQDAYQRAVWLRTEGYKVHAGGPAVRVLPEYMAGVADCAGDYPDAIARHNPNATVTSRGCIWRCPFCVVPRTEGDLVELDAWPVRPTVCDNNLLACSTRHFDRVIDSLKGLTGVDFNQGLDARLLTQRHADRLAELDCIVRLAWDRVQTGGQVMRAIERLRKAEIPKSRIQCYVLIGYDDTPDDALFRLRALRNMGIRPNPMRYQPLNSVRRNQYVAPTWTDDELKRYMKYWSRLAYYDAVPFEEFRYDSEGPANGEDRDGDT